MRMQEDQRKHIPKSEGNPEFPRKTQSKRCFQDMYSESRDKETSCTLTRAEGL